MLNNSVNHDAQNVLQLLINLVQCYCRLFNGSGPEKLIYLSKKQENREEWKLHDSLLKLSVIHCVV